MRADHAPSLPSPPSHKIEGGARRVSHCFAAAILLAVTIASSTGCRLCCDLDDAAYPAYGGSWERTNRNSGRVGSLFDPGGARTGTLAPRDSGGNKAEARHRIAPLNEGKSDAPEESPKSDLEQEKSEEETEQEFQERYQKFQKEKMLSAEVIPGDLAPPSLR